MKHTSQHTPEAVDQAEAVGRLISAKRPHPTDRGALRTQSGSDARGRAKPGGRPPGGVRVLIDWIEWTDQVRDVTEVCAEWAGQWTELPRGAGGYRRQLVHASGLRVLHDGAEGMGVHVSGSGSVCRRLEALGLVADWCELLGRVTRDDRAVNRLDVAVDEVEGLVDVREVERKAEAGEVVKRWAIWRVVPGEHNDRKPGRRVGRTVYFGSPQSDAQCRVYDKAAEQDQDGHWTRVELQLRDDRAQLVAEHLATRGLGTIDGVLRGYLDFKEPSETDSNKRRWRTCAWWDEFLQGASKTRLTRAPKPEKTVGEVLAAIERQRGPGLAMAVEVHGFAALLGVVERGKARWGPLHRAQVAAAMVR